MSFSVAIISTLFFHRLFPHLIFVATSRSPFLLPAIFIDSRYQSFVTVSSLPFLCHPTFVSISHHHFSSPFRVAKSRRHFSSPFLISFFHCHLILLSQYHYFIITISLPPHYSRDPVITFFGLPVSSQCPFAISLPSYAFRHFSPLFLYFISCRHLLADFSIAITIGQFSSQFPALISCQHFSSPFPVVITGAQFFVTGPQFPFLGWISFITTLILHLPSKFLSLFLVTFSVFDSHRSSIIRTSSSPFRRHLIFLAIYLSLLLFGISRHPFPFPSTAVAFCRHFLSTFSIVVFCSTL